MLFNFYIFNRKGKCLFYQEWHRPLNTLSDDPEEEKKLMFGMLFSLKDLVSKLSPGPSTEGLHVVKTNSFFLHHFQSLSGLVFVMNTSPDVPDLYQNLQFMYSQIYVEFISRNPLYRAGVDDPIESSAFVAKIEDYLRAQQLLKFA